MVFVAVRGCEENNKKMHDCAYNLCREMLSSLGISDRIEKDKSGKPRALGAFISISHSHGAVCCAVNAQAGELKIDNALLFCFAADFCDIGVDIEQIHTSHKIRKIAEKIFSPAEREYLCAEDECERFFSIYTRKEAYLKKTGAGLSGIKKTDTFSLPDTFITERINLCDREYIFSVCS